MSLERVKQFKDLNIDFDISGSGNVTVAFWTDMPGGTMSSRKSVTYTATTGRVTKTIPLDGIEGTLMKLVVTPATGTVCRLYAATVRLRPVGVYLDGTVGDIWQTLEIGFGI